MNIDHISCTWKDGAACGDCENSNRLNCRWKASDLLLFLVSVLPSMLGLLAGTLLIGILQSTWWPTVAYIL
ncbi:MAG: hypothetical protein JW760_07685, partial [Spirochaetales bacterium]|nr:hypothetical protein [Spirochaetales bacterium]